mgnify:CR=1 FL=1
MTDPIQSATPQNAHAFAQTPMTTTRATTEGPPMDATFEVGDRVQMPGVPMVVEVLEIIPAGCGEPGCDRPTFRFTDPGGMGDDEMHCDEFVKVTQ